MPPEITPDSSEEAIIEFCRQEAAGSPGVGVGHEMKLNYGLNVLLLKQQRKLVKEQNTYNNKQLGWSRSLAIGTWCLVVATLLLVKFSG